MKNNIVLLTVFVVAAMLPSCTKQIGTDMQSFSHSNIIIVASNECPDTKSSVDGDTGKVYWSPGDAISVFFGETGYKYVSQNVESSTSATFVSSQNLSFGDDIQDIYGIYPYNPDDVCENGVITTELPCVQQAVEGTFADNLLITMGKSTVDHPQMAFLNVCSGVRFTVDQEGITAVTIRTAGGDALSGKVKIALDEYGLPKVTEVLDGNSSVRLECPEGFKPGVWYYIVTLPAESDMLFISFETESLMSEMDRWWYFVRSKFGSTSFATSEMEWDRKGFVKFEDINFKTICTQNYDRNGDGEISYSEAERVQRLYVDAGKVESLKGIECFTNLQYLSCSPDGSYINFDGNGDPYICDEDGNIVLSVLKELDVSQNLNLKTLICEWLRLPTLDVTKNAALESLDCSFNLLTSIDVSNNPALSRLGCGYNKLESLDISKNSSLEELYCQNNSLSSLDVLNNASLTQINCSNNIITELDVTNNSALWLLSCDNNKLTGLDVSHNSTLLWLYCRDNLLKYIDVQGCNALEEFLCDNNQLVSLDVSNSPNLYWLTCLNNPNLVEIWLKEGQTIDNLSYGSVSKIKYRTGN